MAILFLPIVLGAGFIEYLGKEVGHFLHPDFRSQISFESSILEEGGTL